MSRRRPLFSILETLRRPLATNVTIVTAALYGSAFLGLLTSATAARILGPTRFGLAAIVIAYPTLVWSFTGVKAVSVTTPYIARFRTSGKSAEIVKICRLGFGIDLATSILALLIVLVTQNLLMDRLLPDTRLSGLSLVYAASFVPYSLSGTGSGILTAFERFGQFAALQVFERGVALVLVGGSLLAGTGVSGMILALAATHALTGFVVFAVSTAALKSDGFTLWQKGVLSDPIAYPNKIASFIGWNYLHVTMGGVVQQLPLLLLGKLSGPAEAGFYRLAINFTTTGSYIENALGRVTYPVLSQVWGTDKIDVHQLRRTLRKWTLRGGLPVGLLLLTAIPTLPFLVPLVFGSQYRPMVTGLQLMMVGVAVSTVFFYLNPLYYSAGKVALWTKCHAVYVVVMLGLAWWAIEQYGYTGLAAVMGGGVLVFNLVMAALMHTVWERPFPKGGETGVSSGDPHAEGSFAEEPQA